MPLTTISNPDKSIPATTATRLQRYFIFLSEFTYDIEYTSPKRHNNADTLSRLPVKNDTDTKTADADDGFHMSQN